MTQYQPKWPPYQHQLTARRRLDERPYRPSDQDVMAWLMEYGTGKTKIMLDEFGEREMTGDIQDLLVFASAGVYLNWMRNEIPEHLSEDLRERAIIAPWLSGSRRARGAVEHLLARHQDHRRPRILLVNVEAISAVARVRDACRTLMDQGRRVMVVVDESTLIKGWDSRRTMHITDIAQRAAARRISTGLVTPNSPMDLFGQFYFMDWRILGFRSYYGFRARYAIMKDQEFFHGLNDDGSEKLSKHKVVVAYRNEAELAQKIKGYSYRVLKKDCMDLPEKVYEFHDVELTDEQRRVYDEIRVLGTSELEDGVFVTANMVLHQMLRMHQVLLGHTRDDEEGLVRPVKSNRTRDLLEILGAHAGKAIIWTPYDYNIREISEALTREYGPGSVARFWGGNVKTREDEETRWRRDPACRWQVATQSAGGAGRTWIEATLVVYYGSTHNLEHRMNSEDRAHRAGQRNVVTYVDMIARGTVEEKIIAALRRKLNLATVIQGDDYRKWLV